jgi:hypothetical protein
MKILRQLGWGAGNPEDFDYNALFVIDPPLSKCPKQKCSPPWKYPKRQWLQGALAEGADRWRITFTKKKPNRNYFLNRLVFCSNATSFPGLQCGSNVVNALSQRVWVGRTPPPLLNCLKIVNTPTQQISCLKISKKFPVNFIFHIFHFSCNCRFVRSFRFGGFGGFDGFGRFVSVYLSRFRKSYYF